MVSKRLMLARDAVRAFNDGWLNTISRMSAPDVIYIDDESGLTALGPEDFKRVAGNTRRSLPAALTAPTFEESGDAVIVRSAVGDTQKEFIEVIEFDESDLITKVTAHYGDLTVTQSA